MKNKLLVAILLTLATANNAFAAKSATTPINGAYAVSQNEICTSDVTSVAPSNVPYSFITQSSGHFAFVPDTVQSSFSAWATSVVSKGFPNPNPFINVTRDPTAGANGKLAETPIEWGTILVENTHLQTSLPFTAAPTLNRVVETQQFFITSFNYAVPANNNNIKTGYRAYTISVGDNNWGAIRDMYYIISPTTKLFTSASGVNYYQTSIQMNGGNYSFDCAGNYHLSQ